MGYEIPIQNQQNVKKGETLNVSKMKILAEKAEKTIFEIKTDFGYGTGFL